MVSPLEVPPCPQAATVQQMLDYLEWHAQQGRGQHVVEMRGFYWVMPPTDDTHCDLERRVFVRGFQ